MTLQELIKLLKTSGIDSKHQVINFLESDNAYALEILAQSIQERVNEITKGKTKKWS